MAQTPRQRIANEKYAKHETSKRGKPEALRNPKQKDKSPISKGWLFVLLFLIVGGIGFELLRLFLYGY